MKIIFMNLDIGIQLLGTATFAV